CRLNLFAALILASSYSTSLRAEVLARVDGTEITSDHVDEHLQASLGSSWDELDEDTMAEARKSVLEQLIRTTLIEREVKALGIRVSQQEVGQKIDEMRTWLENRFAGETTLEQQLREKYSYMAFLARMTRSGLGLYKHLEKVITQEQVKKYFREHPKKFPERVKARHILLLTIDIKSRLPLPKAEQEEARKKAAMVRVLLRKDASNFDELARSHSQCPSKKHGGNLDWFGRKRMTPDFTRAVWRLRIGQLTGVVKTRFGYHIIQLLDRKRPSWRDARKACIATEQETYMKKMLKSSRVDRVMEKKLRKIMKVKKPKK
ncbi:peptidylprolyl isomerase, partial [Acidimicrobium ferrooxidans]|nr:peptidylprolyl isomerase [Acidimicrobium ferrooxidans]